MKIVLDTNLLLPSVFPGSIYRSIYEKLFQGKYHLCVTTEIIEEYEEIIANIINKQTAFNILQALRFSNNVEMIEVYYKWNLISNDPDDNKFVDCAVAANADYLVSNDKHFNILNKTEFPKVNVINGKKFIKIIN